MLDRLVAIYFTAIFMLGLYLSVNNGDSMSTLFMVPFITMVTMTILSKLNTRH